MRFVATAAILLGATHIAQAQDAWQHLRNCAVTAPADAGSSQLSIIVTSSLDKDRKKTSTIQVRVRTDTEILADKAEAAGAKISVDGTEFADLTARGTPGRLVVIMVPTETKILPAISRGSSATITIPAPTGENAYTFALTGSGEAVKLLTPCF